MVKKFRIIIYIMRGSEILDIKIKDIKDGIENELSIYVTNKELSDTFHLVKNL